MSGRWSRERAIQWADETGWKVGCNFIPSTAVNQLEMWQAETFDPETIERELSWASGIGMNAVRVYLHDLAWFTDAEGFKRRVDRFLSIADSCGIRTAFVLFDDCWFPDPVAGPQPHPVPGVHNSRWVQSPGVAAARDRSQWPRLKGYVQDMCRSFGPDRRVLFWDVHNEPGNSFLPIMSGPPARRAFRLFPRMLRFSLLLPPTIPLILNAIDWIREVSPSQPITLGIWLAHRRLNRILAAQSDIISFHNYNPADNLERQIGQLETHGRPLVCTEYMARTQGSTIGDCLPVFRSHGVSCFNWGLVQGKTQTIYAWKDHGSTDEPAVWFHDLLRPDGTAYREEEVSLLRATAESAGGR